MAKTAKQVVSRRPSSPAAAVAPPQLPKDIPTSLRLRWEAFGANIEEMQMTLLEVSTGFMLLGEGAPTRPVFQLSRGQTAELLAGNAVMIQGQGYLWKARQLLGTGEVAVIPSDDREAARKVPGRFCSLESPTQLTIEGAEVWVGFCQDCRKVHAKVRIPVEGQEGRYRVVCQGDLNPLVDAAINGVVAYLEAQRAEYTAFEAKQRGIPQ